MSTHLPLQDALRLVVDADPASPTMVADASSLLKTGLYVLTGDLSGMAQTPMASHVAPTRPAVPTVVPAAGSTPAGALATQAPARLPFGMASILAAPAAPSRPSRPLAGARVVPGDASRLSMQRFRQAGLSLVALASGRSSMPDAQAPSTTGLKRKRDPMPAGVDAATGTAATADAAVPTDARKAIDLLRSGGFIVPDDFTLQIPPTADRGSIEAKMRRANTKAVYALQTGRTVYAREKQKLLEAVNREYPTHPFLVSDDSRRAAQGMGI